MEMMLCIKDERDWSSDGEQETKAGRIAAMSERAPLHILVK